MCTLYRLTFKHFLLPGHPCPHNHKLDHISPAESVALAATSKVDGCPQCAAALELKDGVGPVCVAGDEAEEGAMEKSDGEDKQKEGSKDSDKKHQKNAENHIGCNPKKQCKELWQKTRRKLWGIVESKYFNRGIMIAILINTISMGIEHHEQVIPAFIKIVAYHHFFSWNFIRSVTLQ